MDVMEEELHDPMDDLEELLEGEMDRLAEAEEENDLYKSNTSAV